MIPTDLKDNPPERRALIGEYVLGLLDESDEAAIRQLIDTDAAAERDYLFWHQHFLALADTVPAQQPYEGLWARIEQETGLAARKAELSLSLFDQIWGVLGRWRGAAAGAALGAVAMALLALFTPVFDRAPPTGGYVAVLQQPGESAAPGWVVRIAADGRLSLSPLVETAVPADRSVQFWTLVDPAQGPRSLGLIQPGQSVELPADRIGPVIPGQLFELTLEPPGGSPGSRPTGPVLFIGRAVQVASN
ncbi:MAG: anti-sigma factor [Alphaproteobacteria bacterium]|nr:anti-sigma factor [Alphaproteobacteria bacterium]MBU0798009.1 anti-sigma factor [Alphaproteobacteria bacterium]MBU0888324.1 anti-sigma factor [Alphaproteobacteria bacterium]MBU1814200.1 anti-sigma factor [Alphaproteobacteria bacterium]